MDDSLARVRVWIWTGGSVKVTSRKQAKSTSTTRSGASLIFRMTGAYQVRSIEIIRLVDWAGISPRELDGTASISSCLLSIRANRSR